MVGTLCERRPCRARVGERVGVRDGGHPGSLSPACGAGDRKWPREDREGTALTQHPPAPYPLPCPCLRYGKTESGGARGTEDREGPTLLPGHRPQLLFHGAQRTFLSVPPLSCLSMGGGTGTQAHPALVEGTILTFRHPEVCVQHSQVIGSRSGDSSQDRGQLSLH
jgi:hypothetical protein